MNTSSLVLMYIAIGVTILIWRILKKRNLKPSKGRLVQRLEKAERILSKYSGGYSGEYLSAEEFHKDLKNAIKEYKNGNQKKLDQFYIWFAPTYQWDDFVREEGINLGDEIFDVISKLKK